MLKWTQGFIVAAAHHAQVLAGDTVFIAGVHQHVDVRDSLLLQPALQTVLLIQRHILEFEQVAGGRVADRVIRNMHLERANASLDFVHFAAHARPVTDSVAVLIQYVLGSLLGRILCLGLGCLDRRVVLRRVGDDAEFQRPGGADQLLDAFDFARVDVGNDHFDLPIAVPPHDDFLGARRVDAIVQPLQQVPPIDGSR